MIKSNKQILIPKITYYDAKDIDTVFRMMQKTCFKRKENYVKISALGSDYLHIPPETGTVLVTDIEQMSTKRMIELISFLLGFGCNVYVDTMHPLIIEQIERGCTKTEKEL